MNIVFDKTKEYDRVVNSIMTNVLIEQGRNGRLMIYNFKPHNDAQKLLFNVTAVVADVQKENIYLKMPLWSYIRLRIKFGKKRRNLKWINPISDFKMSADCKLDAQTLMDYICKELHISEEFYSEINNEYYGWFN